MARSQQHQRNLAGESRHHHVEQEIIKINTHGTCQTGQATVRHHNDNGAPAAKKGRNKKEIQPDSMSEAVTGEKRKFEELHPVYEHHDNGSPQDGAAAMKIEPLVDQDSTSEVTFHSVGPPRRLKIKRQELNLNEPQFHFHKAPASTTEQHLQAQAPPKSWVSSPTHRPYNRADITHHAGGGNPSELGVPAPALAIIDLVVTVPSSSTDQLQNSRSVAAPTQLDPVVFEPGFLPWDQVKMPYEAHRRSGAILMFPSVDKLEEIN